MGRVYYVTVDHVAVSVAQDLLELVAADDKPIKLLSAVVSCRETETNEQFTCTVQRRTGAYTSGSGGSTPTPTLRDTGDPAASFTAEANNTTRATGGTQEILHTEGWPSQGGWGYNPIPGTEPIGKQSSALIIGLEVAPTAAVDMNITAVVEEL